MKGADLTAEWLWSDPKAMTQPILIEKPEGLDIKVPKDACMLCVPHLPDRPRSQC